MSNYVYYVNLTPLPVAIVTDDGNITHQFPPSGLVARVEEIAIEMPSPDGIPTYRLEYGEIVGVPTGTGPTFIVARPVLDAAKRQGLQCSLVVPYPLVRDYNGRIIGCRGFASL